jgi:glycosyltransferase 2 family protein
MTLRQRLFKMARWLFFLASVLYLVEFARHTASGQYLKTALTVQTLGYSGLAVLLFAFTTAISVIGWRALLKGLQCPVDVRPAAAIFCYTQIGKYLPGNVGHYIGRATLAKTRLGIPAGTSAISITQEAMLVTLSAVLVGLTCYSLLGTASTMKLLMPVPPWVLLAAVSTGAALFVSLIAASRSRAIQPKKSILRFVLRMTPTWSSVRATVPYYACLSLINGLAVSIIAAPWLTLSLHAFLLLTAAYALSWLVGFLLPGAPGGLGVRESVFTLLLAGIFPPAVTLVVIGLARIATVCADFLVFLIGAYLMRQTPSYSCPSQSNS